MSKNDYGNNPQNKPEFKMFPMIDCHILLPSCYGKPENLSHMKVFNDVIEKLLRETITDEEVKNFFGKSAEVCGDYTIEKEFVQRHGNNLKRKFLKYDANSLNDVDRILIPISPYSSNFFTINDNYECEGGEI